MPTRSAVVPGGPHHFPLLLQVFGRLRRGEQLAGGLQQRRRYLEGLLGRERPCSWPRSPVDGFQKEAERVKAARPARRLKSES